MSKIPSPQPHQVIKQPADCQWIPTDINVAIERRCGTIEKEHILKSGDQSEVNVHLALMRHLSKPLEEMSKTKKGQLFLHAILVMLSLRKIL